MQHPIRYLIDLMIHARRCKGILFIAALIAPPGAASHCLIPPPPCVAYNATSMIFLGTAMEVLDPRLPLFPLARRVTMRIDRAYKGVTEETVTIFDDGTMGFHVGAQYLIYGSRDGGGDLQIQCTRTRNVKDADEDLRFLNALGGSTGRVSGHVVVC